jgi:SAM-dependent methyltransferase
MTQSDDGRGSVPFYALGHTARELERLKAQARLVDPITRRFFHASGIAPGMRVLDVGCGVGDVTFLVADLVGDAGTVLGVDRASGAVAEARARADARALRTVSFVEGDATEMEVGELFDAIVGRYVLQFAPDPTAMVRRLATHLRPGGVLVFHELAWDGVRSFPPVPTYDQCCRWMVDTLRLLGTETQMGLKLSSVFVGAGLSTPTLRLEAVIGAGANSHDCVHIAAEFAGTLLPSMERLGVASAAEVGLDTLAERIEAEVVAGNSTIVRHFEIGAWIRV